MNCPECGVQMITGARFCHSCGWDSKLAAAGKASSTIAQRPAWKRRSMALTLILSALLMLWLLLIPRGDVSATLLAGQAAPDFHLESLAGPRVSLSSLKGRPVILNFWASWCGPCREEMPAFQAVADKYQDQGLQVIGINVGDAQIGVSSFVQQVGIRFPILLDKVESAQTAYKILPLPATFMIDRQGVIRAIYQYQMSGAQIEAEVQRLLAR